MTLSQTAILTKQVITIASIAIVLGTLSFIGYRIWYGYYLAHLPPVEEKPDTKFGSLPPLNFPESSVSSSNFSYSIDTSTGNLPKIGVDPGFKKIVKVYFVTKTFATLLSSETTKSLAEKFDIKTPPEILSETNYRFQEMQKTLTVNLDNNNFTYKNDATVSAIESLDDDSRLISSFQGFLSSLGYSKEDLKNGPGKVKLLKNDGGQLIPADARGDAVAGQISLWPTPIDNLPILTPEFDTSLVNAVVFKSADNLENYLSLDFTYYPIETSTFATYPIRETQDAFDDLKNGKGIIVITPLKPNVSITSIYMAYFLGQDYSPYLQPIFVFEGPHFAAYVPAINPAFIGSTNSSNQTK